MLFIILRPFTAVQNINNTMAYLGCSMVFTMDEEAYGFYEDIDTADDASAPRLEPSVGSSDDEASLTRCSSRIVDDNAASLLTSPPILSHRAVVTLCESLPRSRLVRLFSTSRDGASFATFMRRVRGRDSTVIVVKTSSGRIIGGYASKLWSGRNKVLSLDEQTSSANQCFLFEVRQSKSQSSSSFIPGYEEFSSSPTSTLDFNFGNLSMQDFCPKVDIIRTPASRLEQVCHLTQTYLSLSDANYTFILEDCFASGMACIDGVTLEAFSVTEFEVYAVSEN